MATNMIISSAGTYRDEGIEVYPPFPGPHSQPYSYTGWTASCLGKTQVACGIICIVLEVLGLGVDLANHGAAPGIWCGLLFVCAGAVSILCGKQNTKDWIKCNLVATSVAGLFTTGPLLNCSLAGGSFGGRLLCWLIMTTSTVELITAICTSIICTSAIWPQYFQCLGAQMLVSSPPRRSIVNDSGGNSYRPESFQVVYVPPIESDTSSGVLTGGGSSFQTQAHHPQTLTVNTGLQAPTCVVIPPTPSPPPGTDEESPTGTHPRYSKN